MNSIFTFSFCLPLFICFGLQAGDIPAGTNSVLVDNRAIKFNDVRNGPIAAGFTLSIQIATNVFCEGKAIPVSFCLKNITTNNLGYWATARGAESPFFELSLHDIAPQNAGEIYFGGYDHHVEPDLANMAPMGQVVGQMNLRDFPFWPEHFFNRPGSYRAIVTATVFNQVTTNVESNEIEFYVLPQSTGTTNELDKAKQPPLIP